MTWKFSALVLIVATALLPACRSRGTGVGDSWREGLGSPYVAAPDQVFVGAKPAAHAPSLEKAVYYAEVTRNAYESALSNDSIVTRIAGLVLTGLGAAAAAIGITNGSPNTIARLSIAGAGGFGAYQLFHNDNRIRLYAQAQEAIGCILRAYTPYRHRNPHRIEQLTDAIIPLRAALRGRLEAYLRTYGLDSSLAPVRDSLARADKVLPLGQAVRRSGDYLYEDVEQVRASVNKALVENEPRLADVLGNLNQSLLSRAQEIGGNLANLEAAAGTKGTKRRNRAQQGALDGLLADAVVLNEFVNELESLTDGIEPEVVEREAKACLFDPAELGMLFRTQPSDFVSLPANVPGAATIVARGGKAPYHARFIDQMPDAKLTVSVDHDTGTSGSGVVTVRSEGAAPGSYRLLVSDERGADRSLRVQVGSLRAKAPPPRAKSPANEREIKAIQRRLIDLKCLALTQDGGGTSEDGIFGKLTWEALGKLFADPVPDLQAKYVNGQKLDLERIAQDIEAEASNAGKRCPAGPAPRAPAADVADPVPAPVPPTPEPNPA